MNAVLSGIRVLDFGRYIAGPFCGMLLADLGAEVIRVEKRSGSEDRFITPITESGEGALFLQLNRNKLSLTLDPLRPEGREIVRKLIATADVIIANLPPQTLRSMGLDRETVTAIKSDVVLVTISAFGEGGPYSERVGFDGVAQAISGAAYMNGRPGDPMRSFVPWADYGTASLAAFGTLAALMERAKTGKGQQVEGALLHTALAFNGSVLLEQAVLAKNRAPTGNRSQFAGPSDIYKTTDGALIVQIAGRPLFERWARLMGEDHWLTDRRFKDDISCGDNGGALSARMQTWCSARTTSEAMTSLDAARIPSAPIYTPAEALNDPHIRSMGFFERIDYPGLPEPALVTTTPIKLSASPGRIVSRAPTLGEHTDEVLAGLGYGTAEIASLREKGVI